MTATHRDRTRYCALCGTRLVVRKEHGVPRRTCPKCGHIHYRNPVPAAGVLLHDGGRVLLVKRKFAPRAGWWCLPAGFMEYGETPRHCAVRELEEETGLRCRIGDLFGVYAGFDDPRVRAILVLYLGTPSGGRLEPGDDAIEAKFFPVRRPPREIAFESHRQALRELAALLDGRAPRKAAAPRPVRAAGPRAKRAGTATPPRRARAARPRSRRG